ncbi:MAG: amidohydrolase family protein [Maribacter sp.]
MRIPKTTTAVLMRYVFFLGAFSSNAQRNDAVIGVLPAVDAHSIKEDVRTLLAGHVIDPKTGTVLHDQTLVIKNGIITSIKDKNSNVPEGELIDLSDAWLLPGLMDAHVHLTWNLDYARPNWNDSYVNESTAFRGLRGLNVAQQFLMAGFTTLKEIGNDLEYATADIIKAIDEGWFIGPEIQYAGKIIAPYGGQSGSMAHQNKGFWEIDFIDADSKDELVKAIRQNQYFGATTIKLVSDQYGYYYDEDDIKVAVQEAAKANLKVTVHTMGGPAARAVVQGGAAGIEHGFDLDTELLELMEEQGTFLIGTDFSFANFKAYGNTEEEALVNESKMVARLQNAYRIGVKMAYGTDIVINLPDKDRVQSSFEVLQTWKKAGIPAMYILKAMTSNASELMGLQDRVGVLQVGYQADIVAMYADPLEDIENIKNVRFVMKKGAVIKND